MAVKQLFICDEVEVDLLLMFTRVSVLWCCWFGGSKGVWPVKTEWWDADMVICLGRGAGLRMVQLMPLPLTVSVKSRLVSPFWYQLTQTSEKRAETSCRVLPPGDSVGVYAPCVDVCIINRWNRQTYGWTDRHPTVALCTRGRQIINWPECASHAHPDSPGQRSVEFVCLGGYDRRSGGGGYQDRRRDYGSSSYGGGGGGYRDRSRDYRSGSGRVSGLQSTAVSA